LLQTRTACASSGSESGRRVQSSDHRSNFEIGEDIGTHFISLEFIEGVTLRKKIHGGRTDPRRLLRFLQTGGRLAKAHAAGIVHRDLKPGAPPTVSLNWTNALKK
jgi:serine/threonine protein kinase